jgi:hypothetical protein
LIVARPRTPPPGIAGEREYRFSYRRDGTGFRFTVAGFATLEDARAVLDRLTRKYARRSPRGVDGGPLVEPMIESRIMSPWRPLRDQPTEMRENERR